MVSTISKIIFTTITLFLLTNCSITYSTTGGSVPVLAKQLAVPNVLNESSGGPANLGQTVTEKLREYFQRNTKLEIVVDNAYKDLVIEGNISGYQVNPINAIGTGDGGSEASQSELTVTFTGKYFNPHNENESQQEISITAKGNAVFPTSQNLTDIENQLIEECVDEILISIYSQTFDTW